MTRIASCKGDGLKKGAWTPEEDRKLVNFINENGEGGWRTLPEKAGLKRCGKSCRLRWANYLRPDIKRGEFTPEEEEAMIKLHALKGNKWAAIARGLPGRTDNEIKNYWNTHIKKRLVHQGIELETHSLPGSTTSHGSPQDTYEISQSSISPRSLSSSAKLLNKVATNLSIKVSQKILSEIIDGGNSRTTSPSFSLSSSGSISTSLNKMAIGSTMEKDLDLDNPSDGLDFSGYYEFPTSASTPELSSLYFQGGDVDDFVNILEGQGGGDEQPKFDDIFGVCGNDGVDEDLADVEFDSDKKVENTMKELEGIILDHPMESEGDQVMNYWNEEFDLNLDMGSHELVDYGLLGSPTM